MNGFAFLNVNSNRVFDIILSAYEVGAVPKVNSQLQSPTGSYPSIKFHPIDTAPTVEPRWGCAKSK
jgi:hypothetical protein